jgi:hypothetical protein
MPRGGAAGAPPLSGAALDGYSALLSSLICAGRLNASYPDPYAAAACVTALGASFRAGVYEGLCPDPRTGLPSLKDALSVQIDRHLAGEFIAAQEQRLAAGHTPADRAAARLAYLRRLLPLDIKPLNRLEVLLRRVDRARGCALFEVVYDAYPPASPQFTRYRITLEQRDKAWGSAFLERSGDYSAPTGEFRARLERCAQDESELLFLILGGINGVRVQEISRARIGPFRSLWTGLPPGWDGPAESSVLDFPLDRASVELKADLDNDPFEGLYRERLSEGSRDLVGERVAALGYRVQKDRKFACAGGAAPFLKKRIAAAGTRNIIYEL